MIGVSWSFEKSKPAPQHSALEPFPLHIMLHTIETRLPDSEFNRGRRYASAWDPGEPKGCCLCGQPLCGKNLPMSLAHKHDFMCPSMSAPSRLLRPREASALLSTPGKGPLCCLVPLGGRRGEGQVSGVCKPAGRGASPWGLWRETTVERGQETPSYPSGSSLSGSLFSMLALQGHRYPAPTSAPWPGLRGP